MCLTTTKYFCTFQPVSVLWVLGALGRSRWHLHLPLLVGLGATCEPLGRAVPIPSDPVFAGQEQGRGTRGEEGGGHGEEVCGLCPTGRCRARPCAAAVMLGDHDAILPPYFIILRWVLGPWGAGMVACTSPAQLQGARRCAQLCNSS